VNLPVQCLVRRPVMCPVAPSAGPERHLSLLPAPDVSAEHRSECPALVPAPTLVLARGCSQRRPSSSPSVEASSVSAASSPALILVARLVLPSVALVLPPVSVLRPVLLLSPWGCSAQCGAQSTPSGSPSGAPSRRWLPAAPSSSPSLSPTVEGETSSAAPAHAQCRVLVPVQPRVLVQHLQCHPERFL
jgi:hypothetical protein